MIRMDAKQLPCALVPNKKEVGHPRRVIDGVDGPTASRASVGSCLETTQREPSMTLYKRIGIDTSKSVFTLHGIDHADRAKPTLNLRRGQFLNFFRALPRTEIVMEACGGAHHWGRALIALGHTVRLIAPQY